MIKLVAVTPWPAFLLFLEKVDFHVFCDLCLIHLWQELLFVGWRHHVLTDVPMNELTVLMNSPGIYSNFSALLHHNFKFYLRCHPPHTYMERLYAFMR